MKIKPVLVPDHNAADLRALMDHFATAAESATPAAQANRIRQQLTESAEPGVAEATGDSFEDEELNEGLSHKIKKIIKAYKNLFLKISYNENGKKIMSGPKAHKEASRQLGVDPDDMEEYLRLEYYDFFDTVNKEWEKQKGNRKERYSNEIWGKVDGQPQPRSPSTGWIVGEVDEDPTKIKEDRPDVMRHKGDTTVRVVKRAGKPIGEIGIDAEASSGNGQYYVKLYDGSYDAVGYNTPEEALAELKTAIKSGVTEDEVEEGWKSKLAAAGLAGAAALGGYAAGSSNTGSGFSNTKGIDQFNKPAVSQTAQVQPLRTRADLDAYNKTRPAGTSKLVNLPKDFEEDITESVDPVEQLRADILRFAR
jgi:hypothetical protein